MFSKFSESSLGVAVPPQYPNFDYVINGDALYHLILSFLQNAGAVNPYGAYLRMITPNLN